MIPLELRLTNFLSYRRPVVVDLRSIQLASISGPNGAGKSTLLDGIVWALFGTSRARSDDDVVNSAADGKAAEVELTFDMEGTVYRVIRRKRAGKTMELEFHLASGDGQGDTTWSTLTEATLTETKAAIVRTLRMNYDVFVNASFFLQGQADAFTSSKATRRKEILAEVLGVTRWDEFGRQATAARRAAESEAALLRRQIDEVTAELSEAEDRQARLVDALAQEADLRARLDDKELLLVQARQIKAEVDKARQQRTAQATELADLQREIDRLQARIAEREQERGQFEGIMGESGVIEADFATWAAADVSHQKWQLLAEQVRALEDQQQPLRLRIATEMSRLEQRQQGLEAQREAYAARQAELGRLHTELDVYARQLAELTAESESLATSEARLREVEREVDRLAAERSRYDDEIKRLTAEQAKAKAAEGERQTLDTAAQSARARLTQLTAELNDLTELGQRSAGWAAERDQLAAQRQQLKVVADREKVRIAELSGELEGDCPLCGQPLTAEHRETVVGQLERDLEAKREEYRRVQEREKTLETQLQDQGDLAPRRARVQRDLAAQQEQVTASDVRLQANAQAVAQWQESGSAERLAELREWMAGQATSDEQDALVAGLRNDVARKAQADREAGLLQQHIARAETRLAQIESDAAAWLAEGSVALESTTNQLATADFAQEERARLAELQQTIDGLAYDKAAHSAAQELRAALATAPARNQALAEARAALKPLAEALAESHQQLAQRQTRLQGLQEQNAAVVAALESLQASAVDPAPLEDQVARLREEMSIVSQRVGAAKQNVAVLTDRARQKETLMEGQRKLDLTIQRLKLLEEACGRKGVQALLIEHALPEIEERANELLDRLSGGAMRVTFETQRELKSGDLAETLEIHISDTAGERPYENFSGGEQFRINFAVRLALSQALANRAGAPLRTLVIDEGFGSQDPEGKQRLVEAINAVQKDFACILVITHVEELRDAFPARIEVSKTSTGSQVEVFTGL